MRPFDRDFPIEAASENDPRLQRGALKYEGAPCPKGHSGLRYARTNACVDCIAKTNADMRRKRDQDAVNRGVEKRRYSYTSRYVDRDARQVARGLGELRYLGRVCRKCGTSERYVNRGACVECTAVFNQATYNKGRRPATPVTPAAEPPWALLWFALAV